MIFEALLVCAQLIGFLFYELTCVISWMWYVIAYDIVDSADTAEDQLIGRIRSFWKEVGL